MCQDRSRCRQQATAKGCLISRHVGKAAPQAQDGSERAWGEDRRYSGENAFPAVSLEQRDLTRRQLWYAAERNAIGHGGLAALAGALRLV